MRKLLFLLLAAASLTAMADGEYQYMVFKQLDGQTHAFTPVGTSITITDGMMTALNGSQKLTLNFGELKHISFSDSPTGLQELKKVEDGTVVRIYNLEGVLLKTYQKGQFDENRLNNQLPAGIYIVKAGGKAHKIRIQ